MTQFCNFFKNGDIIYNQKNMVTGKMSAQFLDISSSFCEVIDHKDIFVDMKTNIFYHKTQLLDGTTVLEWKKTRNGDWDWFVCDITNIELSPIAKVTYQEKKVNVLEQKNLKIKSEIMTESYSIMKKYNISDNDTERITKMIVDMIDKELPK